ncbi:chordin-like [Ostrea edulis]|uniref:chordin-like n=1 Tax=Ostrea edulis TaxID=37623 RepID=UPI00209540DA|nr:chordin-like [Ostrea edulis]
MTPLLTIYVLLQMVVNIDGNIRDRFLLLKHAGNTKERFKVLIPEEVDYGRIYRKYPGCNLGNSFYKLGEKFNPTLNPDGPFVCLICQCVPNIKKGIMQHIGNVKCKNIKSLCPVPRCDNPVLLEGKCCKSCPEEDETFEDMFSLLPEKMSKEIDNAINLEEKIRQKVINKKYVALLVGRNVISRRPLPTRAVAVVHLRVTTNMGLRFSIKYEGLQNPEKLLLTDTNGNVLMEKRLQTRYPDKQICGEWENVPEYYYRYLHKGIFLLVITTSSFKNGEIAGKPEVDKSRQKSTFSTILVSPTQYGIGGYAEMFYGIRSKNLEYTVKFDGLYNTKRRKREYFVTIEKRTQILHKHIRRVRRRKNSNKLRGTWLNLNKKSRKLIAKARLRMRVTSKGGTTIIGTITPAGTCRAFIGVLSSGEALLYPQIALSSAGFAVLNLHDNGHISYDIDLKGMTSPVRYLTIESLPTKTGRRTIIYNLSGQFRRNSSSYDGVASGVIKNVRAKYIALLLAGRLFINVETERKSYVALRGRIESIQYSDYIDYVKDSPFLMTSLQTSPTGVGGVAWLVPDHKCRLHYQIILSGLQDYSSLNALLVGDFDSKSASNNKNAIYTLFIPNFINGMARGVIDDISPEVYKSLDAATSFLQIGVTGIRKGEIVANLSIPNSCWNLPRDQTETTTAPKTERLPLLGRADCKDGGKIYHNDESWIPSKNGTCRTCSCKNGNILCHHVICPKLSCDNQVRMDGECCPTCPETLTQDNETCYYPGDKRHYRAGTVWHPYIPPNGYSTCVTCTCDKISLEVKCNHLPCPILNCPKDSMVRINRSDCCQVCSDRSLLADIIQSTRPPTEKIGNGECRIGKRVYKNKSRWHPVLSSHGIVKCVTCKCKNGRIQCKRRSCKKKSSCKEGSKRKNKCCSCIR